MLLLACIFGSALRVPLAFLRHHQPPLAVHLPAISTFTTLARSGHCNSAIFIVAPPEHLSSAWPGFSPVNHTIILPLCHLELSHPNSPPHYRIISDSLTIELFFCVPGIHFLSFFPLFCIFHLTTNLSSGASVQLSSGSRFSPRRLARCCDSLALSPVYSRARLDECGELP